MRSPLVLFVLVLAACSKAEQPAADTIPPSATIPPASASLSDFAGTWDANAMPMGKDTVLTTLQMSATSTMEGWTLKFPNGAQPAVRVVSVAGDSVITEAGPFASALRKGQQVSVHSIFRVRDGKLVGTTHAKYANGDTATLRIEGSKRP